ncbi:MAG: hypothetical protein AB8B93_13650 [Pseudomonadales bacterium]
MIYLLAKYTLLFLMSLVLGVLLGRWWIRRSYVDVTERYAELSEGQRAEDGGWNKLWGRLDVLDGGIEPKISSALAGLPATPSVDLSGVEQRLKGLEQRLDRIPKPQPQAPVDLSEILNRLGAMESTIGSMDQRVADLNTRAVATVADPSPAAEPATVDLSPIGERIADLERYVRTLPRTDHQLDLSPMKLRLGAIEAALTALAKAPTPAAVTATTPTPAESAPVALAAPPIADASTQTPAGTEPRLFASASAGGRDDLKKISGVGPKLETLLNDNGVYYFWQIASWSDSDVIFMDERLDVFKGRIARDSWVAQARVLKSAAGAAQEPQ